MVAVSDFSGLVSSPCALASAAAMAPIDSLDRCMTALHGEEIKTDSSGFRALSPDAMADRLFGVLGNQTLEFGLGLFMLEMGRSGPRKHCGELSPGVRAAHVDNAHRLDAW